jgi:hypothetical protein
VRPITCKSGELIVDAPDANAIRFIEELAKSMHAGVKLDESR